MVKLISGLHHITALTADASKNLDFYAGLLGLRLVKKTINFDAPEIYHLYYGNERGSPGTILTFFPYPELPQGRKGKGQLTVTSFSIPEKSVDFWIRRFDKYKVSHKGIETRFKNEQFIYFEDHEGLGLELVVNECDDRKGFSYGHIPLEFSIKGFHGITLLEECYEKTARLLTHSMDHELVLEEGNRFRYQASQSKREFVDILCCPDSLRGLGGAGTIHHVAFATKDNATQIEARDKLIRNGFNVTPVLDRQYFHSIYFREPGSVLFEVATLPPGFMIDEPLEHLGEALKLPPWEEKNREEIESELTPLHLDLTKYD